MTTFLYKYVWALKFKLTELYSSVMLDSLMHFVIVTNLEYSTPQIHNPAKGQDSEPITFAPVLRNIFTKAVKPIANPQISLT